LRVADAREVEAALEPRAARSSEPVAKVAAADKPFQRSCQRVRVGRWNEQSGLLFDDELRHAADVAGDDGEACSHRLENRDGQTLREARANEEIGSGEQLGHVVPRAAEFDAAREAAIPKGAIDRAWPRPLGADSRAAAPL